MSWNRQKMVTNSFATPSYFGAILLVGMIFLVLLAGKNGWAYPPTTPVPFSASAKQETTTGDALFALLDRNGDGVLDPSLQAALGLHRYTKRLEKVELSNVVCQYGTHHVTVGSLTDEEVALLKMKKVRVIPIKNGSHDNVMDPGNNLLVHDLLIPQDETSDPETPAHPAGISPDAAVETLWTREGGEDWPSFLGSNRDGKSSETGILKDWSGDKLKVL